VREEKKRRGKEGGMRRSEKPKGKGGKKKIGFFSPHSTEEVRRQKCPTTRRCQHFHKLSMEDPDFGTQFEVP
jgi:hypothetical protein